MMKSTRVCSLGRVIAHDVGVTSPRHLAGRCDVLCAPSDCDRSVTLISYHDVVAAWRGVQAVRVARERQAGCRSVCDAAALHRPSAFVLGIADIHDIVASAAVVVVVVAAVAVVHVPAPLVGMWWLSLIRSLLLAPPPAAECLVAPSQHTQ
jgi:hypothetical protein